jgi:hypothetical protein
MNVATGGGFSLRVILHKFTQTTGEKGMFS